MKTIDSSFAHTTELQVIPRPAAGSNLDPTPARPKIGQVWSRGFFDQMEGSIPVSENLFGLEDFAFLFHIAAAVIRNNSNIAFI